MILPVSLLPLPGNNYTYKRNSCRAGKGGPQCLYEKGHLAWCEFPQFTTGREMAEPCGKNNAGKCCADEHAEVSRSSQ